MAGAGSVPGRGENIVDGLQEKPGLFALESERGPDLGSCVSFSANAWLGRTLVWPKPQTPVLAVLGRPGLNHSSTTPSNTQP
jgi:hypothetical protein